MKRFVIALAVCLLVCSSVFAATRKEIPNGWYGENLPTGEYAVAVPAAGKLVTHLGDVPFGPDEPLYVRITNAGGFKFAGQGHNTGLTVEWGGGFWNTKPTACGVSPVIFDLVGVLHISDCSIGSQGWRYVADDGTLVTGDQSFASGPLQLFEYTTHGDVSVGQGPNGGAIAVSPAGRFVLEPGHTTFIRYNRSGTHLAVTIVKLLEAKTVLLWFDVSELASFPRDVPATPAPTPTPVPTPVPPVPAPQTSKVPEDILNDLQESRKHYPTPLGAHGSELIDEVAWRARQHGVDAGLEEKTGGNNCPQPKTNIPVACDILRIGNVGFDVLADQESEGRVVQADGGPATKKFIPPVGPGTTPAPPPTPTPTPVDPRIAQLTARVAELETAISAERASNEAANLRIRELEAERDQLKAQIVELSKPVRCEAKVPGYLKSLGIKVGCQIIRE